MQYPTSSSVPVWRILGASVTGTDHRKKGRNCDDKHAHRSLDNGSVLLAVADGAGSALRAAEGAAYVVEEACDAARRLITEKSEPANPQEWKNVLRTIVEEVRAGLEKQCVSNEVGTFRTSDITSETAHGERSTVKVPDKTLREFATTLQCVIITPQWLAAAQIGDGAIVIQHTDDKVEAVTWPDHGEYVNQTSFITEANYLDKIQYVSIPYDDIQGIALFTDGLEMLALEFAAKKPYEPFFTPVFKFAADSNSRNEDLQAFLDSASICERTGDDKTLLLAVPLSRQP